MNVDLIANTPNPETTIALAASTCYDSTPKQIDSAKKMIKALIKSGHESTIEHATATFVIDGISRVVTHEMVRHRIGFSYSQRSQRYVDEAKPEYVVPREIESDSEANMLFTQAMENCWFAYQQLQKLGLKNEIARYVLPNACCTKITVSADFRAWRNFLKLRLSKRALPEIRELANEILKKLVSIAPSCFEDLMNEENLQNT